MYSNREANSFNEVNTAFRLWTPSDTRSLRLTTNFMQDLLRISLDIIASTGLTFSAHHIYWS